MTSEALHSALPLVEAIGALPGDAHVWRPETYVHDIAMPTADRIGGAFGDISADPSRISEGAGLRAENKGVVHAAVPDVDGRGTTLYVRVHDDGRNTRVSSSLSGEKVSALALETSFASTPETAAACAAAHGLSDPVDANAIAAAICRSLAASAAGVCTRLRDEDARREARRLLSAQAPVLDAFLAVVLDTLSPILGDAGGRPPVSVRIGAAGDSVELISHHSAGGGLLSLPIEPEIAALIPKGVAHEAMALADRASLSSDGPIRRRPIHQPRDPVALAGLVRLLPGSQADAVRDAVLGRFRHP